MFMPKLLVDKLGWHDFLKRWESETMKLFTRYCLYRGLYTNCSEEWIEETEVKYGISLPRELFIGGVDYPVVGFEQSKALDEKLSAMRTAVAQLQQHYKGAFTGYWSDVFRRNSLCFPPATEEKILAAEKRLGLVLPDSYKDFARLSNGFYVMPGCTLAAVESLGWLRDLNEHIQWEELESLTEENPSMQDVDKYYDYDEMGLVEDDIFFNNPPKLFKTLLLTIKPGGDEEPDYGITIHPYDPKYRLSPPREWEVFFLSGIRAKSFKHLMQYLYELNLEQWRDRLLMADIYDD
jgi:hypothetical protein